MIMKFLMYCVLNCNLILMLITAIGSICAIAYLCVKYGKEQHRRRFKYHAYCIGGAYQALIICRLVMLITLR